MPKNKEEHIGHEIEFLSHGKSSEITGECWWNYKKMKVEASDPALLSLLKETKIPYEHQGVDISLDIEDGPTFLDQLPNYFQSYIAARKKR